MTWKEGEEVGRLEQRRPKAALLLLPTGDNAVGASRAFLVFYQISPSFVRVTKFVKIYAMFILILIDFNFEPKLDFKNCFYNFR